MAAADMHQRISRCRVCNNTELTAVLDLGVQALSDALPRNKQQHVPSGPLHLVKCTGDADACGLLQLEHAYGSQETYCQTFNERPARKLHQISNVRRALEQLPLQKGAMVLHVDCERGAISQTCSNAQRGSRAADWANRHAWGTQLTLRLMQDIYDVLADRDICVLEHTYMPEMLHQNAYDTVCHRRAGYYALRQVKWMTDRVGLKVLDVQFNDIDAGTVACVTIARQRSPHVESATVEALLDEEAREGMHTLVPYRKFADRVAAGAVLLRMFLDRAREAGKTICALGASTRGNVILQYCNVAQADIALVGEVNSQKFGAFTPGTLLPIVPEETVLAAPADYLLVLPWKLSKTFVEQARFAGRHLLFPLPKLELVSPAPRQGASHGTESARAVRQSLDVARYVSQ